VTIVRRCGAVKKKLVIALILLTSFVSALSFFAKDHVQEVQTKETTVHPKPSKKDSMILYKGENDFWKAEFSVTKNSLNQLTLKHKKENWSIPDTLSFVLSTAYDKNGKQKKIGSYSLTFNEFPETLSLTFDHEKLLQPDEKKLLLKITGEGHYQFFNLYLEE
jgi:hypothetical protein